MEPQAPVKTGALLSQGVTIEGDVKFGSQLLIDGKVTGKITSTGELTVGEHGRIKAEIHVGSVTIHGTVDGDVFATDRCAVEAGGTLRGDVESPRLALSEDASFSGSAKVTGKRA